VISFERPLMWSAGLRRRPFDHEAGRGLGGGGRGRQGNYSRKRFPVFGHGSGHGLGLDIHENPFLRPDAKGRLEAGHVLTIEPAVYLQGKLGVRLEDDIL